MPTSTQKGSGLDDLRARRSELQKDIQTRIAERNKLHEEFRARVEGENRPSEDEVARFEARKNHEDENVHPTDEETRAFDGRMNSGPSDEETRQFNEEHDARRGAVGEMMERLEEMDEQMEEAMKLDKSLGLAQRASAGLVFSNIERQRDPLTYREDNQTDYSYFMDLAAAQNLEVRSNPDPHLTGFQDRLDTHAKEMGDVLPARWEARQHLAEGRIEQAENEFRGRAGLTKGGFEISPFERQTHINALREAKGQLEERAPSRIVGQGGYAIPPLWLIDQYIPALRPGRVAAGLCRQMPLPSGTDSINIPRLLTPTLTGIQTADAAPVVSRDFSDTFQQANVKTVAGQEDVPIQLIEQSPGQILDRVLMTDLIADYNKQVDLQVIAGSGVGAPLSGGQVVGIYPAANWGATTVPITTLGNVTTASPQPPVAPQAEFFQFLGAMASKTSYSRFNLMDFNFLMHPRRHFWSVTGLDYFGRPLGLDGGFGPTNAHEIEVDNAPYEGYAGRVPYGPSVYIDANVPITDNGSGAAGGTNDIVVGAIWDDLWLFEGDLRTRVLTEVLSGTLELRFQVYAYIAFLARYGVSIALGYGTPLGQPYTFSGSANGAAF